ncbi:hypothetical protein KCV07_g122, partial [Aureobasidium melanogenum]
MICCLELCVADLPSWLPLKPSSLLGEAAALQASKLLFPEMIWRSGAHGLGGTVDCDVSPRVSSGVLKLYTDGCRKKVGTKCSSSVHDSGVGAYWETVAEVFLSLVDDDEGFRAAGGRRS